MFFIRKKYPFLIVLIAILSFNSCCAGAEEVALPAFEIKNLRLSDATQTLYVLPAIAIETKNESCPLKDYYALSVGDQAFNQMHSMLLAAATAGRKVKLWISDETADCARGRQRVRIVEVQF